MSSRAERERKHFDKEARLLFGLRAGLSEVEPFNDPRLQREEEARLVAVHDPAKPSACRLCGVAVAPTTDALDGWKCCGRCRGLIRGGLAAVWDDILAPPVAVTMAEAEALGNPALSLTDWPRSAGLDQRWGHVDVEARRVQLTEIRNEARRRATPRPNSTGHGCAWCGTRRSTAWTKAPWRWGGARTGPQLAVCSACESWVARSGVRTYVGVEWRTFLLAACVGMRQAQMDLHYGLRAFFESGHPDPAGTDEPWAYLGSLRGELRLRVARAHPRLIDLTERERRVLSLRRAAEEPTRPKTEPLAHLLALTDERPGAAADPTTGR